MNGQISKKQTDLKFPDPPRGLKAIPWRLPSLLYHLGLGGLLGKRFLLLNHVGRKTGQHRQAVLEIIQSYPDDTRYLVASGFGRSSHWYRNIRQSPNVSIQVSRKKINVIAQELTPQSAGQVMVEYAEKNPGAIKTLAHLIGYDIEHSPAGYRIFGESIPVIQFTSDPGRIMPE